MYLLTNYLFIIFLFIFIFFIHIDMCVRQHNLITNVIFSIRNIKIESNFKTWNYNRKCYFKIKKKNSNIYLCNPITKNSVYSFITKISIFITANFYLYAYPVDILVQIFHLLFVRNFQLLLLTTLLDLHSLPLFHELLRVLLFLFTKSSILVTFCFQSLVVHYFLRRFHGYFRLIGIYFLSVSAKSMYNLVTNQNLYHCEHQSASII